MIHLEGYSISFEFDNLIQMSDLIYYDGPLLSHFVSKAGDDYLFYWVDVDEEFNRWMFFRTNTTIIQSYLDKKISLRDIILGLNERFVYLVEVDDNSNFLNTRIVSLSSLPEEYLPTQQSYYSFEKYDYDCLDSLSRQNRSGMFELHLDGNDIGYGSIALNKLCKVLPHIEAIRKDLAQSFNKKMIADLPKGTKRQAKEEKTRALKLDTDYEVCYLMAGSARIILKPKSTEVPSGLVEDERDLFAQQFVNVLNAGFNQDSVKQISDEYGKALVKKYSDFVEFLHEEQIGMQFSWHNAFVGADCKSRISRNQISTVMAVLQNLDLNREEEVYYEGKFTSLNIKTGYFSFEAVDNRNVSGNLDATLMEHVDRITFYSSYSIVVSCTRKAHIGSKVKENNILISFQEMQ